MDDMNLLYNRNNIFSCDSSSISRNVGLSVGRSVGRSVGLSVGPQRVLWKCYAIVRV